MPKQKRKKQPQPKFIIVVPSDDNRVEFNRKYGNLLTNRYGSVITGQGMSPGICRAAVEVVN